MRYKFFAAALSLLAVVVAGILGTIALVHIFGGIMARFDFTSFALSAATSFWLFCLKMSVYAVVDAWGWGDDEHMRRWEHIERKATYVADTLFMLAIGLMVVTVTHGLDRGTLFKGGPGWVVPVALACGAIGLGYFVWSGWRWSDESQSVSVRLRERAI